jgi:hypothetical protein
MRLIKWILPSWEATIREALDLTRFDPDWFLPSRIHENPLAWTVEVDGLLMDARSLPIEPQRVPAADDPWAETAKSVESSRVRRQKREEGPAKKGGAGS